METIRNGPHFKIRRIQDGKFAKGGDIPYFSKEGKIWRGLTNLFRHFDVLYRWSGRTPIRKYEGCEIVEYEVVLREVAVHKMENVLLQWVDNRIAKEDARYPRPTYSTQRKWLQTIKEYLRKQ